MNSLEEMKISISLAKGQQWMWQNKTFTSQVKVQSLMEIQFLIFETF